MTILIPETEYKKQLQVMGIFELREMGRRIGVKSPTTMKADRLIQSILDVVYGRTEPQFSTRGRPPKNIEAVLNGVVEDVAEGEKAHSALLDFDERSEYGELYFTTGEKAVVPLRAALRAGLRRGDEIRFILTGKPADMTTFPKPLSVNGYPLSVLSERAFFGDLTARYPEKRLYLTEETETGLPLLWASDLFAPVGRGQRGVIFGGKNSVKTALLKAITQDLEKKYEDIRVFSLLVDVPPEDVVGFRNGLKSPVTALTFDRSAKEQIRSVECLFEHAKRLAESGLDVFVAVNDLDGLARIYGEFGEGIRGVKRILSVARNTDKGSITLLATAENADLLRETDVFNQKIILTGDGECGFDPASCTTQGETFLSEKERETVQTLRDALASGRKTVADLQDLLRRSHCKAEFIDLGKTWRT